jgi:ferredoxin-NADP reductase
VNTIGAKIVGAATSVESVYITAGILVLILPPATLGNTSAALVVVVASAVAMASKYLLAPHKKHIFNPAALGAVVTGFVMVGGHASWWVGGNLALLPFVLIGGLAIVRKIRRFDLVLWFFLIAVATIVVTIPSSNVFGIISLAILHTSMLFFGFVMLTEPLTTPPTRRLRLIYATIVGVVFTPAFHIANIASSPEIALLVGNLFSYVVSPKGRMVLSLLRTEETSSTTRDFFFQPDIHPTYRAGQFLEWTLPHAHADSRGTRRFFTIASAPSDSELRLGVKFYPKPSTFKQALAALKPGDKMFATQLGGEFVLPKDTEKKLVFVAGGIGITPFHSHLTDLLARKEKRDIVLLYGNRTPADIVYASTLADARQQFGTKIIHVVNEGATEGMHTGVITADLVKKEIPDYRERLFYISGPQAMVAGIKSMLLSIGVSRNSIHTDYFVGLA